MKYGESAFDILYLLFAVISGFVILRSAKRKDEKQMGLAVLILGCGDAFHLVPRVLNYFVSADFTAALGIGKLITSVTMTVFYLLLYHIWQGHYQTRGKRSLTVSLSTLAGAISSMGQSIPRNALSSSSRSLSRTSPRRISLISMFS